MKDEDLISGSLLILAVATIYLILTGLAVAMAREGFVLWTQAKDWVQSLSTFSTLVVGAVVFVHVTVKGEKK